MTNPNNAVGTPTAFKGRTSVKAFNNITGAYTRGIISGWACAPVSGMTVAVGGNAGTRDIAVAEDASGNRTTISNISEAPIEVTLQAAPTTYNRIDSIVLYVNPSPEGDSSTQDNPAACGIIAVKGTPAASAVAPDDAAIRSAITTDGGTGTTAYYVVITNITVGVGVTTITSGVISKAEASQDTTMEPIDITSKITTNGIAPHKLFTISGKHLSFTYQGPSQSWQNGDLIFTVPAEYRPKFLSSMGDQFWMTGTINAQPAAYSMNANGEVGVGQLSGATSGRPYLTCAWDIA